MHKVIVNYHDDVSSMMLWHRFVGWFLHKLLGRLLSAVTVHRGQIQMLQMACKVILINFLV